MRQLILNSGPALLLMAGLLAPAQAQPGDPRGRWLTANGNLEVEIAPCGAALCGSVSRVLGNRSMSGDGQAEMKPTDPRPALGMQLLSDFQPVAAEAGQPVSAWRGRLYNRENGKSYDCTLRVSTADNAAGELILRPYVGLPLFGKTLVWTRVAPASAAQ